jgi:uncharacterized DUF497 family protein
MFELHDIEIGSLRWTPWNIQHIGRAGHETTPQEVEEVVSSPRSFAHMGKHGRLFVLGPTHAGRILAVVLDPEQDNVWLCVSARTANAKDERPAYWQEYKRRYPDE